jgi:hypothetical protein
MALFSIHSIAGASLYDLPSIAESTWHGACLASAEMARRGLVAREKLPKLIEWLSKVNLVSLSQCTIAYGDFDAIRRCTLIYAKVPIPSVRMFVTLRHTFYGRLPEPKMRLRWHPMQTTLRDGWLRLLYMIAKSTFVERRVLRSKKTLEEW